MVLFLFPCLFFYVTSVFFSATWESVEYCVRPVNGGEARRLTSEKDPATPSILGGKICSSLRVDDRGDENFHLSG